MQPPEVRRDPETAGRRFTLSRCFDTLQTRSLVGLEVPIFADTFGRFFVQIGQRWKGQDDRRVSSNGEADTASWAGVAQGGGKLARAFNIWVWLIVIIPTLIAGIYLFGIASDLYVSEARFIVRSQAQNVPSGLSALLQGSGLQTTSSDTFAVESFITSRDAVRGLEKSDHLRDVFGRNGADFVTRFPNLISGSSFEALYKHYLFFVGVSVDSSTGVTMLEVKAYRPEDAQAIAQALLRHSEQLVNEMNARAENDAVQQARREVDEAEIKLVAVQQQLTAFRTREQILDPKLTSTGMYDTLNGLTAARITTETQLAGLLKDSPSSPSIPSLKTRLATLNGQLASAMNKVAGSHDSVADKLSEYERLALTEDLDSKLFASATQSLETARLEAQRQHLYIEHISEPNLSDYPLYPKRLLDFIVVLVTCLLIYGIAWLLIAGIREHGAA